MKAAKALKEKKCTAMLPRPLRVSLLGCFAPKVVADGRLLLGMRQEKVSEVKYTAIAVPQTCIGRATMTPDGMMIRCAEISGGEWLCHPADLPFKVSRLVRCAPSAKRACVDDGAEKAEELVARSPARFEQLMAIARWRAEWLRAVDAKQEMDLQRAESLMDNNPWSLGRRSALFKFVALWSRRGAEQPWEHHCNEVRLCSLLIVRCSRGRWRSDER